MIGHRRSGNRVIRTQKATLQALYLKHVLVKDFPRKNGGASLRKSQMIVESICWKLFELDDDIGCLLLADHLRSWGYSWKRTDLNCIQFRNLQYDNRFPRIIRKKHLSALEHHFLGHKYATGMGLQRSLTVARKHFAMADILGHVTAIHEKMIAILIDDAYEFKRQAIARQRPRGIAIKDSRSALNIYVTLHAINERKRLSIDDLQSLLEVWSKEIYSDYGKRYFNVLIERLFKNCSEVEKAINSDASMYILGLIAENSRSNPTGNSCSEWYRIGALRGCVKCAIKWIKDTRSPLTLSEKSSQLSSIFSPLPDSVILAMASIDIAEKSTDYEE